MFGLFKKKATASKAQSQPDMRSAAAPVIVAYGELAQHLEGSYAGFDFNPAELRFFAMAATSLFVQSYGDLPEHQVPPFTDFFYEQASAELLLHMPRADFGMVHAAAVDRFGRYAGLIAAVINASTGEAQGAANQQLVAILDESVGVDRGAFDQSIYGTFLCGNLVDYAVKVKNAVTGGRHYL